MTSERDTEKEWNKKLFFFFLKRSRELILQGGSGVKIFSFCLWNCRGCWSPSQLSILKLLNQPEFRVAGQPDVHVSQHWEGAGELEIHFFVLFILSLHLSFRRHPLPCRVTAPGPIRAASCPLGPQAVITKSKPSTSVCFLREVAAAPLFTSALKECAQIYCC